MKLFITPDRGKKNVNEPFCQKKGNNVAMKTHFQLSSFYYEGKTMPHIHLNKSTRKRLTINLNFPMNAHLTWMICVADSC